MLNVLASLSVKMHQFVVAKSRCDSDSAAASAHAGMAGSPATVKSKTASSVEQESLPLSSQVSAKLYLNANLQLRSTSTATQAESFAVRDKVVATATTDSTGLEFKQPLHPANLGFPKHNFGKTARAFCPGWYRGRALLEYSVNLNACFCFPCHKFRGINDRDVFFTKHGFYNWKIALEKDK